MSSEEEEEDHEFALYGTLLDPLEEDTVQAKKPISIQDQIATDKHGKRRFHGAFTGGFSAGFCNTVGSLEGWTPSTFKSSRSTKDASSVAPRKPEDFMDDEDMSAFGIAPKSIQVSSSFEGKAGEGQKRQRSLPGTTIPGVPVLQSLLQPVSDTIGSKLLSRMGWKPGQGIGPRLTKQDKRLASNQDKARRKIYGCSLPGQDQETKGGGEEEEEEEEEKSMEKKVKGKGQKENQVDNKQIAVSIDLTSDDDAMLTTTKHKYYIADLTSDEDATLTTTKHKKKSKKVKEDSKEKMSASETCDSDSGVRTRTRVQKKAINKVEDLPVIASSPVKVISDKIKDKVNMFENVVNGTSEESEGRVTRTKTRKLNKSEEEQSKAQGGDVFKIPLAVKNVKEIKKPTIVVKKPADKTKEPPAVDPKQAAIDERRRLREERSQKAAAARDQAEKEKREHAAKLEREREEKLKLKKVRDDKLKEEMEKKKKEAMAKIEQQKREQEAARVARLQEIVEEENRKEAQRKKEQEMAERKVQQAKLADKLKAQQKLQAAQKKVETPVELNYSISEDPVPSDEDEEARPKRPIPSWAKASNRNVVLADQIYLSELIPKFFDNPDDINPSVIELFGEENVRSRPRTSSAVWNRTACE
uniref:G patch domain-containing protein 1 homolog n=1 Tax=Cacopsylla melanoneura TaxID=428564 RepID=A0A8D8V9X2_9HEMI